MPRIYPKFCFIYISQQTKFAAIPLYLRFVKSFCVRIFLEIISVSQVNMILWDLHNTGGENAFSGLEIK